MTAVTRRALLAGAALAGTGTARAEDSPFKPTPFGVASFSYTTRLSQSPELRDPLALLRFCRERGAGGVQTSIPNRDEAYAAGIRRYLDASGTWLEGTARLPRDSAEAERFEADLRAAKAAGAAVVRTVMLGGRRYETFKTAEEYRKFKESSARSVELAAPIAARQRVRLAVENHKDYRTDELVALMRRLGSEWLGVTLDTGNNLALLEGPMEPIEALAPFAFTVHLKDMAVEESPDGFMMSEVPFGKGFLDLPRIVRILRTHRPEIRFNIEMATRDPLLVPCLTEAYWATMGELPAPVLARSLAMVRGHKEGRPLPRYGQMTPAERLQPEDENVRDCVAYCAGRLAT